MQFDEQVRVDELDKPSGIRFLSGTTVYEEQMADSRWLGHSWSSVGFTPRSRELRGRPTGQEAFGLEIDGQSLRNGWRWSGAEHSGPAREGQVHSVVKLAHQTRPVAVRIHTVLDGTAVFERWLEVENTGERPAAVSRMWCFSGRLWPQAWHESEAFDGPGGPYRIGYFIENEWGREGSFQFREIGRDPFEIGEESGKSGWGHPVAYFTNES